MLLYLGLQGFLGFPGSSVVKNLPADAGDTGLISDLGRSPREENGNPLQYSCLENPMERGDWWARVYRVTKSQTGLKWLSKCSSPRRQRGGPWVRKIPWGRKWQPTPVFLPGRFHEQRILVGYSPWGSKESDMTEQLSMQKYSDH